MTDDELIKSLIYEMTKSEPLKLFRQFSLPDGVAPSDVTPLLTEPWREEDDEGVGWWATWNPVRADTSREALKTFYEQVPGPLPPLYERLILTCITGARST